MQVSVIVGAAVARPPIPANIVHSLIVIDASSEVDASLAAAQWVASKPGVVMPVSTQIVDIVP